MDFIKRFFGLPRSSNEQFNDNYFHYDEGEFGRPSEPPNLDHQRRSFHIFSDPLQMHQYFEHQMNEMLKNFGFQGFHDDIFSDSYNVPALEEKCGNKENSEELRDHFLKNGYEKLPNKQLDKIDKDIDGKVKFGDFDSVFGRKSNSNHEKSDSGNFFFGQSKSIKTVKNPDGSVETHRTERDSEGNQETTICRKIGEKEYCVIKKKDKNGKEEIIENFVNMDENEKEALMTPQSSIPTIDAKDNRFPFDIFFR